jgi:predicted nucleic acid-binding protein
MIVLDASAIIEWLLRTSTGVRIDQRVFSHPIAIHVPHLLDVEVAQVLRRYVRERTISSQRGEEVIEDLSALAVNRHPHDLLLPRIWQLRGNLTAYDAVYVALAEVLDVPLVTCDRRLASAPGHSATIDLV